MVLHKVQRSTDIDVKPHHSDASVNYSGSYFTKGIISWILFTINRFTWFGQFSFFVVGFFFIVVQMLNKIVKVQSSQAY